MPQLDYLLVGGGLQNALLASALASRKPAARVAMIESQARVGGNHTWCFHAADIATEDAVFVDAFVAQRWGSYRVDFPAFARSLGEPYAAVSGDSLRAVVARLASEGRLELRLGQAARHVEPGRVELTSGEVVEARVVIDARGPEQFDLQQAIGFQKFVGVEFGIVPGTGPDQPLLMDATVPQIDGFRFFYVLPLAPDRVLVEDTYFSDRPELDEPALHAAIHDYARRAGFAVTSVHRTEKGVLPLPGSVAPRQPIRPGLLQGGYQGGWFHPTTGYSFPLAVRFASTVARAAIEELPELVTALEQREAHQQRFATLLNRMLFQGFPPDQRFHVLERFYRLPAATVRRFYALSLTPADRGRILCGRPPAGLSLRGFLSALGGPSTAPRSLPRT